jgi:hypothetical protein
MPNILEIVTIFLSGLAFDSVNKEYTSKSGTNVKTIDMNSISLIFLLI